MKRTQVKFCGFKRREDMEKLQGLAVDAVGFILVPGRKRTVMENDFPTLVRLVPPGMKSVGVFQNPTKEEVSKWLSLAPLQVVQLHGDESPAFCRWVKEQFGVEIIKTFAPIASSKDQITSYAPWIDVSLIDHSQGGTGERFDWQVIPAFQQVCREQGLPCWIAGGLSIENISDLLSFSPAGVDVSSGIESNGQKDLDKMRQFIENVMECE
jgi:phosphoribosylanthranilate isomerase